MIVVEGPDGAGKTTLINRLREDLGVEVAPRVVSKDAEAMVNISNWVHTNLRAGWQPTIFDRHRLISEPIYGAALRSEWELGFNDVLWLYEALQRFYSIAPEVIYCLPPFETVEKNILSGDDNRIFHGNPQVIRQIYGAYLNKAATDRVLYSMFSWVYDYTSRYADAKYEVLVHHLKHRLQQES